MTDRLEKFRNALTANIQGLDAVSIATGYVVGVNLIRRLDSRSSKFFKSDPHHLTTASNLFMGISLASLGVGLWQRDKLYSPLLFGLSGFSAGVAFKLTDIRNRQNDDQIKVEQTDSVASLPASTLVKAKPITGEHWSIKAKLTSPRTDSVVEFLKGEKERKDAVSAKVEAWSRQALARRLFLELRYQQLMRVSDVAKGAIQTVLQDAGEAVRTMARVTMDTARTVTKKSVVREDDRTTAPPKE